MQLLVHEPATPAARGLFAEGEWISSVVQMRGAIRTWRRFMITLVITSPLLYFWQATGPNHAAISLRSLLHRPHGELTGLGADGATLKTPGLPSSCA